MRLLSSSGRKGLQSPFYNFFINFVCARCIDTPTTRATQAPLSGRPTTLIALNGRFYLLFFFLLLLTVLDCCRDSLGRRQTAIVAVDALHYRARWLQYNQIALMRELNKAVIAFHADDPEVAASQPVAGGMWGCGAFNGDPQFKSLIQLIACAVTNRSIKFFTFGDEVFAAQLKEVHANLISQRVTVCKIHTSFYFY